MLKTLSAGGVICFVVTYYDKTKLRHWTGINNISAVIPGGSNLVKQLDTIANTFDEDVTLIYVGGNGHDVHRAERSGFKFMGLASEDTPAEIYEDQGAVAVGDLQEVYDKLFSPGYLR